jgi:hypothetical protein|eukprot:g5038.t1
MKRGASYFVLLTTAVFATSMAVENPNIHVTYTVKEFGKPAITESFASDESALDDTKFNALRKEREKLLEHATKTFAQDDKIMAHTEQLLDDFQTSTSLLTDEFMGGDKLFEEFFPGALGHRRHHAGGLFSSIVHGMESAFDFGLRHGKHQSRRPWNSKDHAHKSPKMCCCRDIHKFCSKVKTDGSPVGYYKIMKCLADRQRSHGDIHPLCVRRLDKTVAGNCAETIDKKCANIVPGNNALHKCLIQHINDADTSAKCQGYLDLADIKEKKPNKYTRAKSTGTGGAAGVEGFRATTASVLKKKTVPVLPVQTAKVTPKTKLVAAALSSGIAKTVPSAAGAENHHVIKPVYLVAGIAIFVLVIVGSAFAIKKQRQQARELAMSRLANDPKLYKALE